MNDILVGKGDVLGHGRRLEIEHLTIGEELRFELRVVEFLQFDAVFDGEHGGGGGALAHDHEDGLHADAAIRDVAGAEAHGHEQIGAFLGLWRDAAVADGVGAHADLDVALVSRKALRRDVALRVVAVHVVGTHAHAVFDDLLPLAVLLAHHVAAGIARRVDQDAARARRDRRALQWRFRG